MLAGCSVGPNFTKPQATVSPSWHASNDPQIVARAAADSRWWRGFNDAALDGLIELAHKQNLPLQIAGLRIFEARAQLAIATGLQWPQVQAAFASAMAVGISKNAPAVANLPFSPIRYYGDYQLGFDASWELDLWGKFRRGIEAQSANLLSSVSDYDGALISLTAEVARTYVTIRTFEVLIDLAQNNTRIQEQALGIAESRFRNGATSELDPSQATTLLQSTRASIPQLQIACSRRPATP